LEIIPAILTDDPLDLAKKIRQSETIFTKAQVDFMDQKFVPTKSISPQDLAKVKTTLELNAHLMVVSPEQYIEPLKESPVNEITFHIETAPDPIMVSQKIKKAGIKPTIALNPETPLRDVYPLLEEISSILFLSVNPGRYGSPFIPEVLDKIREFKREKAEVTIGLDGGVKLDNFVEICRAPIDIVYVGSGIFGGDGPQKNFQALKSLMDR